MESKSVVDLKEYITAICGFWWMFDGRGVRIEVHSALLSIYWAVSLYERFSVSLHWTLTMSQATSLSPAHFQGKFLSTKKNRWHHEKYVVLCNVLSIIVRHSPFTMEFELKTKMKTKIVVNGWTNEVISSYQNAEEKFVWYLKHVFVARNHIILHSSFFCYVQSDCISVT